MSNLSKDTVIFILKGIEKTYPQYLENLSDKDSKLHISAKETAKQEVNRLLDTLIEVFSGSESNGEKTKDTELISSEQIVLYLKQLKEIYPETIDNLTEENSRMAAETLFEVLIMMINREQKFEGDES